MKICSTKTNTHYISLSTITLTRLVMAVNDIRVVRQNWFFIKSLALYELHSFVSDVN